MSHPTVDDRAILETNPDTSVSPPGNVPILTAELQVFPHPVTDTSAALAELPTAPPGLPRPWSSPATNRVGQGFPGERP